ncbi:transposase family protein [Trichormus azollae]|uniref:transposase family protein n=1 Tax=Trichormus azollae TaxID=1164 RepID=UPI00325CC869
MPGGDDIVDISIGQLGKTGYITPFRNNRQNLDAKQRVLGDKAYIGDEFITTPYHKPKRAGLSEIQKGENKKISYHQGIASRCRNSDNCINCC